MSNLDLFPTLAAATGVSPGNTSPFDGRNMWEYLKKGEVISREDLYFAVGERDYWRHAIITKDGWKLVTEQSQLDQSERVYLFRIEEDPYEKHDLASAHGDLVTELKKRIAAWRSLHPKGDIDVSSKRHPGFVSPEAWAECAIT